MHSHRNRVVCDVFWRTFMCGAILGRAVKGEKMKAIITVDVPKHQIGQEVSVYFKDTMCVKGVCTPLTESDDCVSREAVLNLKREFYDPMGNAMLIYPSDVESLPSVQPKRDKGEWIFKDDNRAISPIGYYECSQCHEGRLLCEDNFCPNCGADMRGEKNEISD